MPRGPIKQLEADLCAAAGIEYIEIPVAIDGLSVLVNPGNDFVECLTVDQLNMIWNPEAERGGDDLEPGGPVLAHRRDQAVCAWCGLGNV